MAEMSFVLCDTAGRRTEVKELLSYELSREDGVPCDGLRLRFLAEAPLGEINTVEAYRGDERVFFGYADTQRETGGANGESVFLYARSSACLLVDNEAQPGCYASPSAAAVFLMNAQAFGFTSALPDCYAEGAYTVAKGTSCYAAVNDLVHYATGKNLLVTPDNVLTLPDGRGSFAPDRERVCGEKRCISRGNVLSRIDYKLADTDGYDRHLESRALCEAGIRRSRKRNLSALPAWQRSGALRRLLSDSAAEYDTVELTVSGAAEGRLGDRVIYRSEYFGALTDYRVAAVVSRFDSDGERTVYTLRRPPALKEITYVD